MAEVDLLVVLVILVHREVDDPAEAEGALLDEAELLGDAGAGEAGEPRRLLFLAGGEEDAVVGPEAHRLGDAVHPLLAMVLGDRAAPLAALARRIAEAGKALAPRPFVHVVEELAALLGSAGSRHRANHGALLDQSREEAEARALEVAGNVGDQQRIAQVRLVCPVL